RLGRTGPSPWPSCGSDFRIARLGRTGPSPWPSCGSHYLLVERLEVVGVARLAEPQYPHEVVHESDDQHEGPQGHGGLGDPERHGEHADRLLAEAVGVPRHLDDVIGEVPHDGAAEAEAPELERAPPPRG